MRRLILGLAISLLANLGLAAPADPPSPARPLAPGLWLVEGGIRPGRQPDGNSVVLAGTDGLIVFDTGRHDWHLRGIEQVLARESLPVVAIFNSHWHLDHVIGDIALKQKYPAAKVYASSAIDGALTDFLANGAAQNRQRLAAGNLSPGELEDAQLAIRSVEQGDKLKPDIVIDRDREIILAGRRLEVRLAKNAATDGDVWLFDPASRTAIVGDLITLPAPFLDTACAGGWRAALDEVASAPFATVIPGHGRLLNRADFDLYRRAFAALIDCANTTAPAKSCVDAWTRDAQPLFTAAEDRANAEALTAYYVSEVLRKNGGDSKSCHSRTVRAGEEVR